MKKINVKKKVLIFSLFLFSLIFIQSISAIDVDSCININSAGYYKLINNIYKNASRTYCIELYASNVTLDLNGYSINANGTPNTGIRNFVSIKNLTIMNGNIEDFYNDIYLSDATNVTIKNLKVNTSSYTGGTQNGIYISGNNITIDNITVIGNANSHGIRIIGNNFNIINNQVFYCNLRDGYYISGNYGVLKNNNITGNGAYFGFSLSVSYSLVEDNKVYGTYTYKVWQQGSYSNFTNNQFGTTYDQFNFRIFGQGNYGCKNSVMPYLDNPNNYVTSGECAKMTIWDNMPHTTKYNHTIWSNYTFDNGTIVNTAICNAVLNGTTYSMPQNVSLYLFNRHLYDVFNYSGSIYCEKWGVAQKIEIPYWVVPLYCPRNWVMIDNKTSCFNSTIVRINETFYDFEMCDDRNLTYNNIYNTNCQEDYLCSNGTCLGCGDNICSTEINETYLNCCIDCGCPSGKECFENECWSVASYTLKDLGRGIGNFLTSLGYPLLLFMIFMAIALMVGLILNRVGKGIGDKI